MREICIQGVARMASGRDFISRTKSKQWQDILSFNLACTRVSRRSPLKHLPRSLGNMDRASKAPDFRIRSGIRVLRVLQWQQQPKDNCDKNGVLSRGTQQSLEVINSARGLLSRHLSASQALNIPEFLPLAFRFFFPIFPLAEPFSSDPC